MRWDSLFSDLEAQFSADRALETETEISERARVEVAGINISDRLRAVAGSDIGVVLAEGSIVRGRLGHVGSEWLVLTDTARQWLVPYSAVVSYQGLGRLALKASSGIQHSLGIASALRALARDRAELLVHTTATAGNGFKMQGVIDRVGHDHFDLAVVPDGEVRRVGNVSAVVTIPIRALAAICSANSTAPANY